MHRIRRRALLVAVLLAAALVAPLTTATHAAPAREDREHVIVLLSDPGANAKAKAEEISRAHGGRASHVFERLLRGFAVELPPQAIEAVRRRPDVALVEPDHAVTLEASTPTGVDRIEADKNSTASIDGRDTRVNADIAIFDSGIAAHSDLFIAGGVNCTGTSCVAGSFGDINGHGTHVAGTAAALDNGVGVVGVAPGARLWGIKVMGDDGSGKLSSVIAGLEWVVQRGDIEVANLSLSCECVSTAFNDALTRATAAGLVIVAAAGNRAQDASTISPANHPNVIAVSAVADFDGQPGRLKAATCSSGGTDDSFAAFSNYGALVDIAAPGVCISSTLPGGGYGLMSGTSMASPHVAGAAALYIVERQIGPSATRWSAVLAGLRANWSTPQSSPCGFTGGKSPEPMLLLSPCGGGGSIPLTGTITGKVTNAGTGAAIAGATVKVDVVTATGTVMGASVTTSASTFTATTGSDGSYTITDVPPGSHTVTASANGYASKSLTVTVESGKSTTANFALSPPALSVAVQPNKTSYYLGETATITVNVTSDGSPVSGATVRLTIRGANGRTASGTATSDANGTVRFSFRTSSTYGRGTYTATASATKTGYSSGSGSVTFSVR